MNYPDCHHRLFCKHCGKRIANHKIKDNVIYGSEKNPKTDKEWDEYWYFKANSPDDYPNITFEGNKIKEIKKEVVYVVTTYNMHDGVLLNGIFTDGKKASNFRTDLKRKGENAKLYIVPLNKGIEKGMII